MKIEFKPRDIPNKNNVTALRIWEKPKPTLLYAIGVDISEGVNQDASVAQVICVNKGLLVANFWTNTLDTDTFASEIYKLGMFYNKAHMCIESNNHGHAVISNLTMGTNGLRYPNLYKRVGYDEYTQKKTDTIGFKTTSNTKPRLIENLKAALRDGELLLYDGYTILELNAYVRDAKSGKLGAGGNAKDDRVMALALANEQRLLLKPRLAINANYQEPIKRECDSTGFPI